MTTCSTEGAFTIASWTIVIRGIALPRRIEISAVITTFASASLIRMFRAVVPKPAKTTLWTAPIRAHASIAISCSGTMGI